MRPTLHPSKQAFKKKKTGTSWIYLLFLISNSATLSRAREHHSALSDHGSVRAWPGPLAGAAGPLALTGRHPQDARGKLGAVRFSSGRSARTAPADCCPLATRAFLHPGPSRTEL